MIDLDFEENAAKFYQSLGIYKGPGDAAYRIAVKTLAKAEPGAVRAEEIRQAAENLADDVMSRLKSVLLIEDLAVEEDGAYRITRLGLRANAFLITTDRFYRRSERLESLILGLLR